MSRDFTTKITKYTTVLKSEMGLKAIGDLQPLIVFFVIFVCFVV